MPSFIRELTFYCIIFDQTTAKSLQNVYESYFRDIDNLKEFIRWFKEQLKKQYSFYFIDRLKKKRFVCKAPSNL